MALFDLDRILPLQEELARHPIYGSLRRLEDLRVFMSHHVYSVWDFMSLIKYLQQRIAPIEVPWTPRGDAGLRYFINQLVLEEESDKVPGTGGEPAYGSHFECYCKAMEQIGADVARPRQFIDLVRSEGIEAALRSPHVPTPSRDFTETTFCFIREDKPHEVAAALALGRERVIPEMFRHFLREMKLSELQAPDFHYYLTRHIKLDEDFHGPLSLRLLETLCGSDRDKIEEAAAAAEEALCARIRFWDGVLTAIEAGRDH